MSTFDRDRVAVLSMDFQRGILSAYAPNADATLDRAARVLAAARSVGIPVIHVVHRGAPVVERPEDAAIHDRVAPLPDEKVLTKVRPGPFSTTGLDVILRELRRDQLFLMGIATSGVVLSGVRAAVDLGFSALVIKDAVDDRDPEVHRVLTEKVYRGALTADEVIRLMNG